MKSFSICDCIVSHIEKFLADGFILAENPSQSTIIFLGKIIDICQREIRIKRINASEGCFVYSKCSKV